MSALCNLLECFFSEKYGFKLKEWLTSSSTSNSGVPAVRPEFIKRCVSYIFAFAFTWSICSTVHEQHIDRMNTLVRDSFPQVIFPSVDTIYSYYLDIREIDNILFRPWSERLSEFLYDKELPFFSLLVPTIDTCRYSYISEWLLADKKHVYLTGQSGTGKSVILSTLLKEM